MLHQLELSVSDVIVSQKGSNGETLSLTFLHLILRNTIQDMKLVSMFFLTIKQQSLDLYHLIPGIRLPSVK